MNVAAMRSNLVIVPISIWVRSQRVTLEACLDSASTDNFFSSRICNDLGLNVTPVEGDDRRSHTVNGVTSLDVTGMVHNLEVKVEGSDCAIYLSGFASNQLGDIFILGLKAITLLKLMGTGFRKYTQDHVEKDTEEEYAEKVCKVETRDADDKNKESDMGAIMRRLERNRARKRRRKRANGNGRSV